ncbi:MAG: gamma-glutamyl-gamma-aminobutyrate hydrolase family protein [Crocinitomicaceae bacterium]
MIAIVNFGSSKVPDILTCVESLGYSGKVLDYSLQSKGDSLLSARKWDKVILSGAPILLSQLKDYSEYIDFTTEVLALDIPILGICFGHQIIGLTHGAICKMGEEDRSGQMIEQLTQDPIFDGLEEVFEMQQDHCEFIELPNQFLHLAQSQITYNEVMKHPTKPIYGCQFHPEVSGPKGLQFLKNFLEIN